MSNELVVIEQSNQRVLTTKQLAQVYECQEANISNNFNNNKDRFTEGKDYFLLQGASLKEFKGYHMGDESLKFVSVLYLWTERGANRHCKILDTNKSWEQFDILEENYFRAISKAKEDMIMPTNYLEALKALVCSEEEKVRLEQENSIKQQVIEEQEEQIITMQPKVDYHDTVLNSNNLKTVTAIAKDLGISAIKLNKILAGLGIQFKQSETWYLKAGYQHLVPEYCDYHITEYGQALKWTEKGRKYLMGLLEFEGYIHNAIIN